MINQKLWKLNISPDVYILNSLKLMIYIISITPKLSKLRLDIPINKSKCNVNMTWELFLVHNYETLNNLSPWSKSKLLLYFTHYIVWNIYISRELNIEYDIRGKLIYIFDTETKLDYFLKIINNYNNVNFNYNNTLIFSYKIYEGLLEQSTEEDMRRQECII